MMKWIDITQPLQTSTAHWPGDLPFHYATHLSKEETGSVNIGSISMSLHSGTHADAPFHVDDDGKRIGELSLSPFIGKAQIIDVSEHEEITAASLEKSVPIVASRVLLKPSVVNDPKTFPKEISPVQPSAIHFLHERNVQLIGVDVPSVDSLHSIDMRAHHAINRVGMYILENLMLDNLAAGVYFLSALPLNIIEGDGSPVRAVVCHYDHFGGIVHESR